MQQKIRVTTAERALLKEHAWQNRTDVSTLVRKKLTRFADKGLSGIKLPRNVPTTETKGVQISFVVDDELWHRAVAQASLEGVKLAPTIRASLVLDATPKQ